MNQTPKNWDDVAIADFGEIVGGGTPSRATPAFWNGTIPWVTPSEITSLDGKYVRDTQEKITSEGLAGSAAKLLPIGSVVITTRATLGETAIAAVPLTTNQGFKSIVPNEETDSLFTYYRVQTLRPDMVRLASGTTFLEISKADFSRIRTCRPKPDEQTRIAAVLDLVDEAIAKTEAVIAKLRQVRDGLLHDLLTCGLDKNGQLRNPTVHPEQFQDSPLGRIPKEWDAKALESCVSSEITYGIVQAGPHFEGGVPYIRTGDMNGDRLLIDQMLRTSPDIAARFRRSRVQTSEIVCAIRATVGKVLLVPPELDGANLTQGTARIAPKQDVNPTFLLWAIRGDQTQRQIAREVKGTTFFEITLADLRKIKVTIPQDPEEQKQIAASIQASEARLANEADGLSKLHHLKSGLMTDLLTGRVRVPALP